MKLRDLAAAVGVEELGGGADVEVTDLAYDSRRVEPGALFFCVRGLKADGHGFAEQAAEHGAVALVVERRLDVALPQVQMADARAAMAPIAARFFGHPSAQLELCGITGTNGKTTTAFLLRAILESTGRMTGLLGTVARIVGGVEEGVERTTPEAIDLQRTFRRMFEAGDRACVMEVSSHALALNRIEGTSFDVRAFTNLTQDHLDFHADMEEYFAAKQRLFSSGSGTSIVNLDDGYGKRLASEIDCLTFSAAGADADFRASGVQLDASGIRFRCLGPDGEADVTLPLPGRFNVGNALTAIASANVLGVELEAAAGALAAASRVPGRFEPVDEGQPFAVLVDYAHTPDSLRNALAAARALTSGRLICVFGCGGDRDRAKRPLMGRVAAELADLVIVTSDNPRSEDPRAIIAEVLEGAGDSAEVEPDRQLAIAGALARAAPGDAVLIAGKGHERGQEFERGRRVPFDDREVAREQLRALKARA